MKCLKCEREMGGVRRGTSSLMPELNYIMCNCCGNIMLEENGILANTPEDNSPMTRLMIEDAAKAFGMNNIIASLDGIYIDTSVQPSNTKKGFIDYVNGILTDDNEAEECDCCNCCDCSDHYDIENEENQSYISSTLDDIISGIGDPRLSKVHEELKNSGELSRMIEEYKNNIESSIGEMPSFLSNLFEEEKEEKIELPSFIKDMMINEIKRDLIEMFDHIPDIEERIEREAAKGLFDEMIEQVESLNGDASEKGRLFAMELAKRLNLENELCDSKEETPFNIVKAKVTHKEGKAPVIEIENLPEGKAGEEIYRQVKEIALKEERDRGWDVVEEEAEQGDIKDYICIFEDGTYDILEDMTKGQLEDYINSDNMKNGFFITEVNEVTLKEKGIRRNKILFEVVDNK